jgi:predicted HAD superfamily Cof-like phosphohydrolase
MTDTFKQYDQVTEFMTVMGQGLPVAPGIPASKIVSLRHSLIQEENEELLEAVNAEDLVEIADALCDLHYVQIGAIKAYGFSKELFSELFDEVHRSNMSKVCSTHEEALLTIEKYNAEGIPTYTKHVGNFYVVARNSDNKVLKSINYSEPDLRSILIKHGHLAEGVASV